MGRYNEFFKLGSRIVTETLLAISENSLLGPMGAYGDVWTVPCKAATIGPRGIVNVWERVELHNLLLNERGSSWQRMVSRLFRSWYCGIADKDL